MRKAGQKQTSWARKQFLQCVLWCANGRALENFMVSGVTTQFYPDYVKAYAMVKLAAARANTDVGRMTKEKLA